MLRSKRSLYASVGLTFNFFYFGACSLASDCPDQNADFEVTEVRIDLNQLKKAIALQLDGEVNEGVASVYRTMQAEGADSEISRLIKENQKLREERDNLKKENSGLALRREMSQALATVKLKSLKSDKELAGSKILCLAANDKLETLDVRLLNAEGVLRPSLFFQWRVVAEENETRNDDENGVSGQAVSQSAETAHKDPAPSAEGAESSSETEKRNDIAGALSESKSL
jgi:transposase-like protein